MRGHLLAFVPVLLATMIGVAAPASGQSDEPGFLRLQAVELDKFAQEAFDQGLPQQARRSWQEILQIYDADHGNARRALGFRRGSGGGWIELPDHVFPLADNPDRRALQKVGRRWQATAKQVGGAHRGRAEQYRAAGREDRAVFHFQRALRFLPDDPDLQAASGLKTFYGLAGTELEQRLYENSRRLGELVAAQRQQSYPVEDLPSSRQNAFLVKAEVAHKGFKTRNYTLWSDLAPEFIREIAQNLERTHAFCAEVFTGKPGFHAADLRIDNYVFLRGGDLYKKVLRANQELFRPDLLEFLLQHTAMCDMGKGEARVQISGDPVESVVRDLSFRWPSESWSSMRSDALREGTGHAVVAMFMGHIEVFSMDMVRQEGTATKDGPRQVLIPDVDSWTEIAIESAFRDRGTPLDKMPLLSAAKFTGEDRVRAWSYCDYLLRRDPRLLLELDATRDSSHPPQVRERFLAQTGIEVALLEREWRDFWTGATPVLRALRGKKAPYDAASKDAAKWLEEFNRERARHRPARGPAPASVTWNAGWSMHCKQHAEYLQANRGARGAAAEQTQVQGQPSATGTGQLFAEMALVSTKGRPARVIKDWIHLPGYRDAILNPELERVGLFAETEIAVFDVIRGVVPRVGAGRRTPAGCFPAANATGVPTSVELEQLGPEVAALIKEQKVGAKPKGAKIGYPISLHRWRGGSATACTVTANGKPIAGVLHAASGGANRRSSAPGMSVFYPLAPLPKGARIEVVFQVGAQGPSTWSFKTR